MKNNFNLVLAALTFVTVTGLGIIFSSYAGARGRAIVAEEKVRVLEGERIELEVEFERAEQDYKLLKDSLDQVHDSIAEIRESAKNRATESSIAFEENVLILRDSLESFEGLGVILDTLRAIHLREVSAYQDQITTLESDKVLLWKRVEATDSMWIREQEVNDVLRREIVALNEEADAWKDVGSPGLFRRIGGATPYVAIGMLGGFLITRGN
jgi:chromosome segregation ATPase